MKLSINKILFGLLFVFGMMLVPSGVVKAETLYGGQMALQVDLNKDSYYPNEYINVTGDLYDIYGQYSEYFGQATAVNYGYITDPPQPYVLVQCNPVPPISGDCVGSIAILAPSVEGGYNMIITLFDQHGNSEETQIPFNVIARPVPTVTVKAIGITPSTAPSNPLSIPYNTQVKISWTSQNATSCACTYSGGSCGTSTLNNVTQYSPGTYTLTATKTFNVVCNN